MGQQNVHKKFNDRQNQDTEVHSVSAVSGEPVFVKIVDGKVADYAPKTLHALTFPLGQLSNWAGSC